MGFDTALADSGFSDDGFLRDLERRKLHYIVAARLQQPLQRALVAQKGWWTLDDGIELASFDYQNPSWDHPRRVVGIRQQVAKRAQAKGRTLSLFADDPVQGAYRYGALITDMALPAQQVWRTYRGRSDCENRIKELKYDFAADSLDCTFLPSPCLSGFLTGACATGLPPTTFCKKSGRASRIGCRFKRSVKPLRITGGYEARIKRHLRQEGGQRRDIAFTQKP